MRILKPYQLQPAGRGRCVDLQDSRISTPGLALMRTHLALTRTLVNHFGLTLAYGAKQNSRAKTNSRGNLNFT